MIHAPVTATSVGAFPNKDGAAFALARATGSGSLADRLAGLKKCRTFKRAAAMRRNAPDSLYCREMADKYLWHAAFAFHFDR